jgi:hypothetical protein
MLILKDCTALEELPQTIGKLSRLKNLDVQGCSTLKALPDSVGELLELTQLNLSIGAHWQQECDSNFSQEFQ